MFGRFGGLILKTFFFFYLPTSFSSFSGIQMTWIELWMLSTGPWDCSFSCSHLFLCSSNEIISTDVSSHSLTLSFAFPFCYLDLISDTVLFMFLFLIVTVFLLRTCVSPFIVEVLIFPSGWMCVCVYALEPCLTNKMCWVNITHGCYT